MLHLAFTERALLGDEMGLGKTAQAVAACALLRELRGVARVLVVCPVSLKAEWEEQITKLTELPLRFVQGAKPPRLACYENPPLSSTSHVVDGDTPAASEALSCPLDPTHEPRVVLELVVEPVLFGGEPDEHPRRASMARDDDRSFRGASEVAGQIVLHLGQRDALQDFRPSRSSHSAGSRLIRLRLTRVGSLPSCLTASRTFALS